MQILLSGSPFKVISIKYIPVICIKKNPSPIATSLGKVCNSEDKKRAAKEKDYQQSGKELIDR